MRAVALAVRGLWWRRGASAVIGAVAVVCVAVAAGGPAYVAAARDAVVQTTLADAPSSGEGTGLSVGQRVVDPRPGLAAFRSDIDRAFGPVLAGGAYRTPVLSIQAAAHVRDVSGATAVTSPLVYRDDVCTHVTLVSGRCPTEDDAGAVLVSEATAAAQGWKLGTTLPFDEIGPRHGYPALHVAGVYRPRDTAGGYWFAATHDYFGASATTDAVFVTAALWAAAPVPENFTVTLYADLALVPSAVHDATLTDLAGRVRLAAATIRTSTGPASDLTVITTSLPSVVFRAQHAADAVGGPVVSVAVQLLVLTFVVLFLLMVGSSDSRGVEVAIGKLRGLSPIAAVGHALLEPTLLLAAALPLGVGMATLAVHLVVPSVVGPTATVAVGAASWLAGAAVAVAGVLAGLAASVAVLRRPVLAQWRRTERRPRRTGWIVEAVVVVLALAATSQLLDTRPTDGPASFLPSAAPALLAVAFALIGARVLPLAARAVVAATRRRGPVAPFIAVRQLARRPGGLRVFGVIAMAVALVVFGVCSHEVFQDNRIARATADVGAARVLVLQTTTVDTDVAGIVDRLDPSGRQATAVYQGPFVGASDDGLSTGGVDFARPQSSVSPTLLVVDPDRFARVASWSPRYGAVDLGGLLSPLQSATPKLVAFTGTALHVTGTVASSSSQPVVVRVGYTDRVGRSFAVAVATVRPVPGAGGNPGTAVGFDRTVSVACSNGCDLRRLSVDGQPFAATPLRERVGFTAIEATGGPATTSLLPVLRTARWSTFGDLTRVITDDPSVTEPLALGIDATDPAGDSNGFGAYCDVSSSLPGLVTPTQESIVPGGTIDVASGETQSLTVEPRAVDVLPRAGDAGVLVTHDWLVAAQPDGFTVYAPNQVWLSASAPADFPEQLAAAGIGVASVESIGARAAELARQGPSFAVAALGFGAGAAGLLAVVGAVATFVVAARRRLYELAALRALGMRPRRVWLAVVLEQLVVAVAAGAVGALAGVVGARIALRALPEFADDPTFPALVVDLPVVFSVLASVAVVLAVVVVTGVAAGVLVGRADSTRLRDGQG